MIRRTGQSTSIALKFIAECIDRPFEWRPSPLDHDSYSNPRSRVRMADMVSDLVEVMNLEFQFKRGTRGEIFIRSILEGVDDGKV